jgi:hypothetical protein
LNNSRTAIERPIADAFHARGDVDGGQAIAAIERPNANACDRVTYCYIS